MIIEVPRVLSECICHQEISGDGANRKPDTGNIIMKYCINYFYNQQHVKLYTIPTYLNSSIFRLPQWTLNVLLQIPGDHEMSQYISLALFGIMYKLNQET